MNHKIYEKPEKRYPFRAEPRRVPREHEPALFSGSSTRSEDSIRLLPCSKLNNNYNLEQSRGLTIMFCELISSRKSKVKLCFVFLNLPFCCEQSLSVR